MKILKIKFSNLNSLCGTFDIDFRDKSYTDNGIFVITGPTGAGKSTILDAITLALYSKTPRLEDVGGFNEIMSRSEGQCFSSVVFEASGKVYEAFFAQHRSHKKIDGALQNKTHTLSVLDESLEKGTIIASGRKTAAACSEITGLDFNNFTRAVMLTQGNFASFLKAGENERAELLEKITGTEIYSEISSYIFRATEDLRHELEILKSSMGQLDIISADEEKKLIENKNSYKIKKDNITSDINLCAVLAARAENYKLAKSEAIKADMELTRARQEKDDNKELFLRLNRHKRAYVYYDEYASLLNIQHNLKLTLFKVAASSAVSKHLETHSKELENKALEYKKLADTAQRALDEFNLKAPAVASLDSSIASYKKTIKTLDLNLKKHDSGKNTLLSMIQAKRAELGSLEHQKALSAEYIEKHRADVKEGALLDKASYIAENLADVFKDDFSAAFKELISLNGCIKNSLGDFILAHKYYCEKKEQSRDTRAQLKTCHEKKQSFKKDRESIKNEISSALLLTAQINELLNTININNSLIKDYNDCETAVKKLQQTLDEIKNKSTGLEQTLESKTQACSDLQRLYELDRLILSCESLRKELKSGSPCPVCGSTEHPYADYSSVFCDKDMQRLNNLKEEIEAIRTSLDNLEINRVANEAQIRAKQENMQSIQIRCDELSKNVKQCAPGIKEKLEVFALDLDDRHALDTAVLESLIKKLTAIKDENDEILKLYDDNDRDLERLTLACSEIDKNLNTLLNSATNSTSELYLNIKRADDCLEKLYDNDRKINSLAHNLMSAFSIPPAQSIFNLQKSLCTGGLLDSIERIRQTIAQRNSDRYVMGAESSDIHYNTEPEDHSIKIDLDNALSIQKAFEEHELNGIYTDYKQSFDSFYKKLNAELNHARHDLKLFNEHSGFIESAVVKTGNLDREIDDLDNRISLLDHDIAEIKEELKKHSQGLNKALSERTDLLGSHDVSLYRQRLEDDLKARSLDYTHNQDMADLAVKDYEHVITINTTASADYVRYKKDYDQSTRAFLKQTECLSVTSLDDYKSRLLDKDELLSLTQKTQSLDDALHAAKTLSESSQAKLSDFSERYDSLLDSAILKLKADRLGALKDEINTALGAIESRLEENSRLKDRYKEMSENFTWHNKRFLRYSKLNKLIGTADGRKYRRFVQSISLEYLINLANKELSELTDRYVLTLQSENKNALDIHVIDLYQYSLCRPTDNLSGGETFLISLALSLALSSMASMNVRVDSLFLDEGFGTLDDETLDMALNALSSLQRRGRLIGVISHVARLKERIRTQIEVTKLSGGRSTIKGPGCRAQC